MRLSRVSKLALAALPLLGAALLAQPGGTPARTAKPTSDVPLVKNLLECRSKYQETLEQLRLFYLSAGDVEKARWAEEELRQYHRISKQSYRLEMEPLEGLQPKQNIPEANQLYMQALGYKDKGWSTDYIDNQRRAELLLQQLLTNYSDSDKIADAAYQLGDIYESRAYKQYRRAAYYYERAFKWNPTTHNEARLRAARLYDRQMVDRKRARELYSEVITHDTDPRRIAEAQKRLNDLGNNR
jgi:TolA-binding protein